MTTPYKSKVREGSTTCSDDLVCVTPLCRFLIAGWPTPSDDAAFWLQAGRLHVMTLALVAGCMISPHVSFTRMRFLVRCCVDCIPLRRDTKETEHAQRSCSDTIHLVFVCNHGFQLGTERSPILNDLIPCASLLVGKYGFVIWLLMISACWLLSAGCELVVLGLWQEAAG